MERYPTRQALLADRIPKYRTIAELGVWAGDFSKWLWMICRPRHLYLVDTWQGDIVCGDQDGRNLTSRHGDDLYAEVVARFRGNTVTVIRADTSAIRPYRPIDFLYIDADHEYASVAADLATALATVADDGLIGGHDYCPQFPGVMRAVDEFCATQPWQMVALTEDGCPSYLLQRQ